MEQLLENKKFVFDSNQIRITKRDNEEDVKYIKERKAQIR